MLLWQRPDGDTSSTYVEGSPAIGLNRNFIFAAMRQIDPHFPGPMLSDKHSLLTVISIGDHNGTAGAFYLFYTPAHPTDRVGMIEVILLLSVSLVAAS